MVLLQDQYRGQFRFNIILFPNGGESRHEQKRILKDSITIKQATMSEIPDSKLRSVRQ